MYMVIKNFSSCFSLILFLSVVFLLRLFLWENADLNLGFDEAQYWTWSQNLEWGYYSKPPFLAWLINSFTFLCGDSEFCIRISSQILHSISALFVGLTAYNFSSSKTKKHISFIAGSIWILVPGISLSSGFISTDVPLLFFTSIVLWSFSHIIFQKRKNIYYIIFCLALSLGFLSKYAIVYFIIALIIASVIDKNIFIRVKNSFSLLSLFFIVLGFFFLISSHLYWNYNNSFITAHHTLANANISGEGNSIKNLLKFFFEQFFVFGPLTLIVLLSVLFKFKKLSIEERILIFLTFTPLILVMLQAFISRAHANWAAIGYIPATVLVALQIDKLWPKTKNIYYGIIIIGVFLAVLIPITGKYNLGVDPFKKYRGWSNLGLDISNIYKSYPEAILVTDDRRVMAEALYYMKIKPKKWVRWNADGYIHDHYELVTNHDDLKNEIGLMISSETDNKHFIESFKKVIFLKNIYRNISNKKNKEYKVWLLQGYISK
jgi:4-amino-4-deoxy-L-arabinose transferase-like glycosyltransferase